ncbi:hypothetical protein GCM10023080_022710 [Streptomyces pseudoechinosporeus]
MSDRSTARTDGGRSGPDAHRPRRRRHPRRWAAVVAVARAVVIAVGLVTAYYLLPLDERGTAGASALLVSGLVAVLLVFGWEVRVIARSPHPRLRAVEALAATLVLFLVLFADAYYLLDRSAPDSFSEPLTRTDALYFTLTTFSTVGFGDITRPLSDRARADDGADGGRAAARGRRRTGAGERGAGGAAPTAPRPVGQSAFRYRRRDAGRGGRAMTVPSAFTASLSPAERAEYGRNARRRASRSSHGWYETAQQRVDPIEVIERQSAERVPELVPIRYGRMLESPFRFYRGAAAIMAADLAPLPSTGLRVQLCGDAHPLNFRLLASPERRLVFDINERDFAALEAARRSGRIRAERL